MVSSKKFIPPEDTYSSWLITLAERLKEQGFSATEVAGRLNMSESSFYKRRSGAMDFNVREFLHLSDMLNIPITSTGTDKTILAFEAGDRPGAAFDAEQYIAGLRSVVSYYAEPQRQASSLVRISTSDIPVFWFLRDPILAAFKLFVFETENVERISKNLVLTDLLEARRGWIAAAKDVADGYFAVNSEEIWGATPLRSTLYQLIHLAEAKAMDVGVARQLFDALSSLVGQIKAASEHCRKSNTADFFLHQNRFQSSSSIIGIQTTGRQEVFITFDNPSYVRSTADSACDYFNAHFNRAKNAATRINGRGIYSGRLFEQEMLERIERTHQRVINRLSERSSI